MSSPIAQRTSILTPRQCRAARALLGWDQGDLAERTGKQRLTVVRFENGQTQPHDSTLRVLRTAFESAGIRFIHDTDETGVTLSPNPDR